MPDFDALPLILAGPIVRRVEPTLVSVWVALSESRTVELGIWVGQTTAPTSGTFFGNSTAAHTAQSASIRIGEKLHLVLATIDLTANPLIPGQIYAYNLVFIGRPRGGNADLSSEKYLVDKGPASEPTQLALGYVPGELPTFSLPPTSGVTATNFPTTWRQELVTQQAKFSSDGASSHAFSFGEYCSLHLFFWSNVLWDDLASKTPIFPECPEDDDQDCQDADNIVAGLPNHLQSLYPADKRKERVGRRNALRKRYKTQLDDVKVFRKALPKVRRALANVPCYMIFDDHELTDDWYLTQDWRDKVLTSPLGVTILRNGLLSFALFQAWGNDPKRYESGNHLQLLTLAQALLPADGAPHPATANQLDALFGLGGADPQVKWHFTVPTGPTTTVVLDTRTHRSFDNGRYSPPGLISSTALDEQLPASLAPSPGAEALFVVSSAPVLGLPLIEELAQPIGARGKADFFMSVIWNHDPDITGYMEFDMEAWALDAARSEALLARFNEMKKVVIVSGDVHYACCAEMDYWKKSADAQPYRAVDRQRAEK